MQLFELESERMKGNIMEAFEVALSLFAAISGQRFEILHSGFKSNSIKQYYDFQDAEKYWRLWLGRPLQRTVAFVAALPGARTSEFFALSLFHLSMQVVLPHEVWFWDDTLTELEADGGKPLPLVGHPRYE